MKKMMVKYTTCGHRRAVSREEDMEDDRRTGRGRGLFAFLSSNIFFFGLLEAGLFFRLRETARRNFAFFGIVRLSAGLSTSDRRRNRVRPKAFVVRLWFADSGSRNENFSP